MPNDREPASSGAQGKVQEIKTFFSNRENMRCAQLLPNHSGGNRVQSLIAEGMRLLLRSKDEEVTERCKWPFKTRTVCKLEA